MWILCILATVYMLVLASRAVLSWFPVRPGTGAAALARILYDLTEPVLRPLRGIIPPAGMFDLSFIVAFMGLFILRQIFCQG